MTLSTTAGPADLHFHTWTSTKTIATWVGILSVSSYPDPLWLPYYYSKIDHVKVSESHIFSATSIVYFFIINLFSSTVIYPLPSFSLHLLHFLFLLILLLLLLTFLLSTGARGGQPSWKPKEL